MDKTPYLKTLKKAGRYLFFIRLRRFGKSLFISLMQAYFDVFYKDRFEELFKGTWIYDHPTDEKGNYLVLTFNFSAVDPDAKNMEASFLNHVRGRAVDFIQKYNHYLPANRKMYYYAKTIEENHTASDILSNLLPPAPNGNFSKLKEIIEENGTSSIIARDFPLEKLVDADNFKSLLYLGQVTSPGCRRSDYFFQSWSL